MFIPTSRDSGMDEIRNGFYVTIFSNSSMKTYPKNKITAFTFQLAREIYLGTNRWEVVLWEFSCPPPEVGTFKPKVVVGDTHAFIYCTFINPQLVGEKKVPCIRTYTHPTTLCNHF